MRILFLQLPCLDNENPGVRENPPMAGSYPLHSLRRSGNGSGREALLGDHFFKTKKGFPVCRSFFSGANLASLRISISGDCREKDARTTEKPFTQHRICFYYKQESCKIKDQEDHQKTNMITEAYGEPVPPARNASRKGPAVRQSSVRERPGRINCLLTFPCFSGCKVSVPEAVKPASGGKAVMFEVIPKEEDPL